MPENVSELAKKRVARGKPSQVKPQALEKKQEPNRSRGNLPKDFHKKIRPTEPPKSHTRQVLCDPKTVEKERLNAQNSEFVAFVQSNQWKTRADRGYPKQGMSSFDYVAEVYNDWLLKFEVLQSDFKALDRSLWNAFQKDKQKGLEPEWLPMGKELRMQRADSSGHKAEIARQRELSRERQARFRQNNQLAEHKLPTLEP